MSDWSHIVQTVVSGVVSGGAGAATTLVAFFKEQRSKIEKLEKIVGSAGSSVEPRTGLHLLTAQLDDRVEAYQEASKKFRREVEGWQDNPPDWLVRLLNRRTTTSVDADDLEDYHARTDQRIRLAIERMKRLEEAFEVISSQVSGLPEKFERQGDSRFVDVETYTQDSKERAEEIRRIQENLQSANSFLRGVMATLGYVDSTGDSNGAETPRRK